MIDRRRFLLSVAGAGVAAMSLRLGAFAGGPAEVLLMRHAEEPDHGPHLNERGKERAAALVKLFPSRFPTPSALFATRSTDQSARPMETIAPLAAALHLPVDDTFGDRQYLKLANTIRSSPALAGKHVLVCWHHGTIGNLAAALGVVRPPKWSPKQYDHIWRIQYTNGRATLTDEPERLLPHDDR
jgi:phosphohistidine phosphatase SixA